MLDRWSVKLIKAPLEKLASPLAATGITANQVTVAGFVVGMTAVPMLALKQYGFALVLILLNRICDGIDGILARKQGVTDCGGFLDIVLDFIFYSAVVFGFALADPSENALAGAALIFSFMGTGSSFLGFAVMAGKRGLTSPVHTHKSLYYLEGLTEGTETIAFFVLFCLFPDSFPLLAWIFASACWVTTASRIWTGYRTLKENHTKRESVYGVARPAQPAEPAPPEKSVDV